MFLAFFHKKQHCRLKLDHSVTRKKVGGRRRTEAFTHTGAFAQRSLYTKELFTHRRFYTEKSLLEGAFAHKHLGAFTHRSFYTKKSLHRGFFTHRCVCTQKLLHREKPLHGEFLHTEAFTHREIFTQTRFHTEKLSHTEGSFYTQRSFYTRKLLHTKAFTQRSLCTEAPLHEVTSWNWQQFFRKPFAGAFENSLAPNKTVYFQQICSKKPKEYISEAGPHSIAFKPTLRWNRGPSSPAEPTMSVSSKINE